MIYQEKQVELKNKTVAIFRSPNSGDAAAMLEYLKTISSETYFVMYYPEEITMTDEAESDFLNNINKSATTVMIVCEIDGEIAGNCMLRLHTPIKTKHRATVAIGLISKFWNWGIGTAFLNELKEFAKAHKVTQLELDYIEGNERAKHLYEKVGFNEVAVKPDAIRLKGGKLLNEYSMICRL